MGIDQVDDLLTMQEAADLLKVSPITIKRYLKQGRLRAYHVGPRAIRIRKQDLTQIMQPTQLQEVSMPHETGSITFPKPTAEELRRRQALIKRILTKRETRNIAPMTTAELVRLAREESTWYGQDR